MLYTPIAAPRACAGRDARHQRGQHRFEHVEGGEETRASARRALATPRARQRRSAASTASSSATAPTSTGFGAVAPVGIQDRRHHQHERERAPPAGRPSSAAAARGPRRTSSGGTTTNIAMSTTCRAKMPTFSRSELAGRAPRRAWAGRRLAPAAAAAAHPAPAPHHPDRRQRQHAGQREEPAMPIAAVQHRRADQRQREHEPDRRADHRHHLGALLSRVRSAAIAITTAEIAPAPCSTRPAIAVQMSSATAREEAAGGEEQQARRRSRACGRSGPRPAERNLQDRLREAVGAERDADERQVVAARAAAARAPRTPAG